MDKACKKGYHQEDYRHRIVPVVGATFFHSGIAEGIFKQRDGLGKARKEIKQVAKPETKTAIEVKRQQRIGGGKDYGYDDQGERAVKIPFHFAKAGDGDKDQNIGRHVRHKIQRKNGADDLTDYHIDRIWRFRCEGNKFGIGDGSF